MNKFHTANVIYCSTQLFIFIEPINTRFHVIHKYSLNIRKEMCFLFHYDLIIKIVNFKFIWTNRCARNKPFSTRTEELSTVDGTVYVQFR
jgi:hypothetical protein